jgi:hypothetical protein
MNKTDMAQKKYRVLVEEDVQKHLSSDQKNDLYQLQATVLSGRLKEGKSISDYLVIDRNEPYIGEIIEILKRNNYWS